MEYYQLKEDYSTMQQQQVSNMRNQSINTRNHSFSTRNIAPESGPLGRSIAFSFLILKIYIKLSYS